MRRFNRLVYFARREDGTGPIKIGASAYPKARVAQLACDMAEKVVVIAEAEGGLAAERTLHRRFAAHRVEMPAYREGRKNILAGRFEWFEPIPELLALIEDVRSGVVILPVVDPRVLDMAQRYLSGSTLQQIGDELCITRERVRQILDGHGYPTNPDARDRYLALAKRVAA